MSIRVFMSYPKPSYAAQQSFIDKVCSFLTCRGLEPRTLGVNEYDYSEPLRAVRRMMIESNGLITIAFRRTYIEKGYSRFRSDITGLEESDISGKWLTSPWAHIEPAMAYQLGLPILLFKEKGVIEDGMLEKGIAATYIFEFDLDTDIPEFHRSDSWVKVIAIWESHVRRVAENKGVPPRLY